MSVTRLQIPSERSARVPESLTMASHVPSTRVPAEELRKTATGGKHIRTYCPHYFIDCLKAARDSRSATWATNQTVSSELTNTR
jgi:hypothetical protein